MDSGVYSVCFHGDFAIREVLLHVKRERVRVTSDSGAQIATHHVRVH